MQRVSSSLSIVFSDPLPCQVHLISGVAYYALRSEARSEVPGVAYTKTAMLTIGQAQGLHLAPDLKAHASSWIVLEMNRIEQARAVQEQSGPGWCQESTQLYHTL